MIRKTILDAIVNDPDWKGGAYSTPPLRGMRAAMAGLWVMTSAPLVQQRQAPTRAQADSAITARHGQNGVTKSSPYSTTSSAMVCPITASQRNRTRVSRRTDRRGCALASPNSMLRL